MRTRILATVVAVAACALGAPPQDYSALDATRSGALLRAGAKGAAVTALQHALEAAGTQVATTGVFDAATVAAVKSFQGSHACAVDGVVGPQTMHALDAALGPTTARKLRRCKDSEITPAIRAAAIKILHDHGQDPIGTEVPFDADGKHYVGRVELHYHPPGGKMHPWGYHHGISVFEVL